MLYWIHSIYEHIYSIIWYYFNVLSNYINRQEITNLNLKIQVESDGQYERIGGTSVGGGTFWGLGSIVTKAKVSRILKARFPQGPDHSNRRPGARPTNDITIELEIRPKFLVL